MVTVTDKAPAHVVRVVDAAVPVYRSQCSCGAQGEATANRRTAERDAETHAFYNAGRIECQPSKAVSR